MSEATTSNAGSSTTTTTATSSEFARLEFVLPPTQFLRLSKEERLAYAIVPGVATQPQSIEGQHKRAPIVLIVGWTGVKEDWDHLPAHLASLGHSVLVFDHLGCGESIIDENDTRGGRTTVEQLADDCATLIRHVFPSTTISSMGTCSKVHLLGISMGGMIAQIVAARHTELIETLILGCTTISIAKPIQPPAITPFTLPTQPLTTHSERRALVEKLLALNLTQKWVNENQPLFQWFVDQSMKWSRPMKTSMVHALALQSFDGTKTVKSIQHLPILIIHGQQDGIVPVSQAHVLAQHFPNADLALLPEVGHLFWTQAPKQTNNTLIVFLNKHEDAREQQRQQLQPSQQPSQPLVANITSSTSVQPSSTAAASSDSISNASSTAPLGLPPSGAVPQPRLVGIELNPGPDSDMDESEEHKDAELVMVPPKSCGCDGSSTCSECRPVPRKLWIGLTFLIVCLVGYLAMQMHGTIDKSSTIQHQQLELTLLDERISTTVQPPSTATDLWRASLRLPLCPPDLASRPGQLIRVSAEVTGQLFLPLQYDQSSNEPYYVVFLPDACRYHYFAPRELRTCLANRTLWFQGDSLLRNILEQIAEGILTPIWPQKNNTFNKLSGDSSESNSSESLVDILPDSSLAKRNFKFAKKMHQDQRQILDHPAEANATNTAATELRFQWRPSVNVAGASRNRISLDPDPPLYPIEMLVVSDAVWDMGANNQGISSYLQNLRRLVTNALHQLPPTIEFVFMMLHALHPQRCQTQSQSAANQKCVECNTHRRQQLFRHAQYAAVACGEMIDGKPAIDVASERNASSSPSMFMCDTWDITASTPSTSNEREDGANATVDFSSIASNSSPKPVTAADFRDFASSHSPDGVHFDHTLSALQATLLLQRMCVQSRPDVIDESQHHRSSSSAASTRREDVVRQSVLKVNGTINEVNRTCTCPSTTIRPQASSSPSSSSSSAQRVGKLNRRNRVNLRLGVRDDTPATTSSALNESPPPACDITHASAESPLLHAWTTVSPFQALTSSTDATSGFPLLQCPFTSALERDLTMNFLDCHDRWHTSQKDCPRV